MEELIKLVKKKMVEKNRDDFVNYLAEILDISKQWASAKLGGKTSFSDQELKLLDAELNFEPEELKKALGS